jgi:hypothetical protein
MRRWISSSDIEKEINLHVSDYKRSKLAQLNNNTGEYVIKFINSEWAHKYLTDNPLRISGTPALTWGTATYVTPVCFGVSSALYGRIGVVASYDPSGWRIYDATSFRAEQAYMRWARSQPVYSELMLTVHSVAANHELRNLFRRQFKIDCVLFHPDQQAEAYTNANHIWLAVTDWKNDMIQTDDSVVFGRARFCVLVDEDFQLRREHNLPIKIAARQIENVTRQISGRRAMPISSVHSSPMVGSHIVHAYSNNEYLHFFIEP